jgi:hypothetical protein
VPRGGPRPGAGRKRGSLSRKTTEVAQKAAAQGITPLEVLLQAMRHHYDAGDLDRAAVFAKDAAPYMHPRLSAVAVSGGSTPVSLRLVEEIIIVPETTANGDGHARNGNADSAIASCPG